MTDKLTIRSLNQGDRAWVRSFVAEHWGAEFVVVHGAIYRPHELSGFVAIENGDRVGLVTYHTQPCEGSAPSQGSKSCFSCEIVTLDSVKPNRGIGTALIDAVRRAAIESRCKRLWLVATNDNVDALRFYQRRGFVLAALHRGAVDEARKIKPSIPMVGTNGIAIRDEIKLEMGLKRNKRLVKDGLF